MSEYTATMMAKEVLRLAQGKVEPDYVSAASLNDRKLPIGADEWARFRMGGLWVEVFIKNSIVFFNVVDKFSAQLPRKTYKCFADCSDEIEHALFGYDIFECASI